MKKAILLLSIALASCLYLIANEPLIPFHKGDFASLKARAQSEQKLAIIEFYTARCGVCVKLEKQTFSNPELATFISQKYVPFRIDGLSFTDEGVELAQKYHVRAYPTIVVIDSNGNLIKTLEGFFTPSILISELTNPKKASRVALFGSEDSETSKPGKVLKTLRPKGSTVKSTGNALAIFFSAYALEVYEFGSYGEAQDAVRVWDVPWEGEIWIIPVGQGRHKLILGPLNSKSEAEAARKKMLKEHQLETQVLNLTNLL